MIGSLEADLRRRTGAILDAAIERGTCDLVVDIARALPLQAIATLMGVPEADQDQLCDWVDAMWDTTDADRDAAGRLFAYGSSFVAERRRCPVDDMLSIVAAARLADEEPEQLTQAELEMFFTLLFTAGSETTRKAIAGGILELVRAPSSGTASGQIGTSYRARSRSRCAGRAPRCTSDGRRRERSSCTASGSRPATR